MLKPLEAKCITTLHMIQFRGRDGGWGDYPHTHRENKCSETVTTVSSN